MSQDTTPKKTHCLGRYLVDLQADTRVDAKFKYASGDVETKKNVSQSSFESLVSKREAQLKNTQHKLGGSMLDERLNFGVDEVLLQSWSSSVGSKKIHLNEVFIYAPQQQTMFRQSAESSASAKSHTIELFKRVASSYQYREPASTPSQVGFCIDSGLIVSALLSTEEVSASFKFKSYPTVSVYFKSYVTGNPDAELLSRTGGIPGALAGAAAGMNTLRRANRDLGAVKGQELLVRANADGKRAYEFLWESQGKSNSIEFPFLSLKLTTSAETNEKGQIVDAPFKTDQEALKFWDDILQTLRLRPGAV